MQLIKTATHRIRARWGVTVLVALAALLAGLAGAAIAAHYEESLEGSEFEIDYDANLRNDSSGALEDWEDVVYVRNDDVDSGQTDDSFKGGTKEDTECPQTTTGSIPNNKSDLLTWGFYVEEGDPAGFLHLFWTRVQEPSGTTLMDFEFNKNAPSGDCNGFAEREDDDLLIEYAIDQGGSEATVTVRRWDDTAGEWGPAEALTPGEEATGTINDSEIPWDESAGLLEMGDDPLSLRTFGEASIDLLSIFDPEVCESFGSGFLKSRSSDSFTSQLKDFIAPDTLTLSNCGSLKITKTDDAPSPLGGATFTLYEDDGDGVEEIGSEDLIAQDADGANLVCTTDSTTGICVMSDILYGDYWLDETVVPSGYNKAAGLPQAVTIDRTAQVSVSFTNPRKRGSILVEKVVTGTSVRIDGASFALDEDGDPLTTSDQTSIPAARDGDDDPITGLFCIDGLLFGDYNVVEIVVPSGYSAVTLTESYSVSTESTCEGRLADTFTPDLTFENTAQPSLVTSAQTPVTVGETINDTATLSGGYLPTGTITFNLFDNSSCEGDPVFTSEVSVSGNGDYTSGNYTTEAAGTLYWLASYSGDSSNSTASHDCNITGETSEVDAAQPSLVTSAQTPVTVGETINDTATLSGGYLPTGTITFNLFDNSSCEGDPVFTSEVSVSGNGDYTSGNYTTEAAGTLYWLASYDGDDNNEGADHDCNITGETSLVNPDTPSLSTSPKLLPNDSATLADGFGYLGGTLTFELYATANCSGSAMYEEEVEVDGAGTYSTSNTDVFVVADGTYSWLVTYTGDANNNGSTSTCDEEQQAIDFTPIGE